MPPRKDESAEVSAREKGFHAMYRKMELLYREDDVDGRTERELLATILLSDSELPLIVRAKCHMVKGSGTTNQVWHAQEAVRVLRFVLETYGNRGEDNAALLKIVEDVLAKAKHSEESAAKLGGDDEGDEQAVEHKSTDGAEEKEKNAARTVRPQTPTLAFTRSRRVSTRKATGEAEKARKAKKSAHTIRPHTSTLASARSRRRSTKQVKKYY